MKIKYISNASIFLEGKNSKVLFDPWITFNNNSNSNYYNFFTPIGSRTIVI